MVPVPAPHRSTLAEVAKAAGVSIMTASYTYNKPARVSAGSREKVLAAAERLGYPGPDPSARSLRRGATGAVGVVLGENLTYAFDDPPATAFLAGVAEVCTERGLAMMILPTNGSSEDSQRILEAAVDGFIVWTMAEDEPLLDALARTGRPTVIHGGPSRRGFGLVAIDDRAAARAIAEIGLHGASRPAIMSFPLTRDRNAHTSAGVDPATATYPVTRNRLLGFQEATIHVGFDWDNIQVASCPTNSALEAETAALEMLTGTNPPDTFLAMSDEQAVGIIAAAKTADRKIPTELAVTGWDNSSTAAHFRLTTISQSMRDQGTACTFALTGDPAQQTQPWSLITGKTTR